MTPEELAQQTPACTVCGSTELHGPHDPAEIEEKTEPGISVQVELPKRSVTLQAGGRTVQVEGPDDLGDLVDCVEKLWPLTDDPRMARGESVMGFHTELAVPAPVCGFDPEDDGAPELGRRAA